MKIMIDVLLLIAGFILLIKGADYFVEGSSKIAAKFHIPQLVIGLTIVAFGTSAPEAAISINAAIHGNAGITIGNIVGSNILNILLILGITSVILPLAIQKSTLKFEVPFVILTSVLLLVLGAAFGSLGLICGIIFWVLFLAFFAYLIWLSKKGEPVAEDVPEAASDDKLLKLVFITLLGLAAIIIGSQFTVDGAKSIASALGVTERIIGLTVVAFGTSLPELITSVTAALKGKNDIAIGNIVGSNLFNILFVIGTTSLITTVPFEPKFILDGIVCIGAACLLWLCVVKDRKLKRPAGILMLVCYAVYFVYLCLHSA